MTPTKEIRRNVRSHGDRRLRQKLEDALADVTNNPKLGKVFQIPIPTELVLDGQKVAEIKLVEGAPRAVYISSPSNAAGVYEMWRQLGGIVRSAGRLPKSGEELITMAQDLSAEEKAEVIAKMLEDPDIAAVLSAEVRKKLDLMRGRKK